MNRKTKILGAVLGSMLLISTSTYAKPVEMNINNKIIKVNEEKGLISFTQFMVSMGYEKTDDKLNNKGKKMLGFELGDKRVTTTEGENVVCAYLNKFKPKEVKLYRSSQVVEMINGDLYVPTEFIHFFSNKYTIDGKEKFTSDTTQLSVDEISSIIDGDNIPKMTEDEVKKLVGKKPEEIRAAINTIYDLLTYMRVSNFGIDDGSIKYYEFDKCYEYNKTGKKAIETNSGNCGGKSNTFNYLLGDNYDIGYFAYISEKGGHVFNYIKKDDVYYVVDLVQYKDDRELQNIIICISKDLNEIAEGITRAFNKENNKVEVVWTYKDYENIMLSKDTKIRNNKIYLPEQYKENINIIKDIKNRIVFKKVSEKILKLGR